MSRSSGMAAYSEAGPAWLLPRTAPPTRPAALGLGHRHLGRPAHDQVPHGVVTVEQGAGWMVLHQAQLRLQIDPARAKTAHILRKSEDAVPVGPARVGEHHQVRRPARALIVQPDAGQDLGNECLKPLDGKSAHL